MISSQGTREQRRDKNHSKEYTDKKNHPIPSGQVSIYRVRLSESKVGDAAPSLFLLSLTF